MAGDAFQVGGTARAKALGQTHGHGPHQVRYGGSSQTLEFILHVIRSPGGGKRLMYVGKATLLNRELLAGKCNKASWFSMDQR